MKKLNILRLFLLHIIGVTVMITTGCNKKVHESDTIPPDESKSVITINLNNAEVEDKILNNVHLYFFDASEKLSHHTYYSTMQSLASERLLMETGYYTIFAILNTEESLVPVKMRGDLPQISFSEFGQWVKKIDDGTYPNLATGLVRQEAKEGDLQITIDIKNGSEAVELSTIQFNLTFPSPQLPDFVSSQSQANGIEVRLRGIIEVYKKDKKELVLRKQEFLVPSSTDGVYTTILYLPPGEYDLRIWCDYTTDAMIDNHYITIDADIIRILPKTEYIANTDTRDAFSKTTILTVGDQNSIESIQMHRPVAKYRLIATDIQKYEQIRNQKGYPPLEDLQIFIGYEGFFPNAYCISQNKPADSQMGYSYNSKLSEQEDNKATIGKDYIFVNGTESFVTVTILFKDSKGNTISGVKGVNIEYRIGELTTISGNFLTAELESGITINTDWSGDYNIEF